MLPSPGIWLAKAEYVRLLAQGPEAAAAMGYSAGRGGYQKIGDVAIISLGGLLSKGGGWFGSSTVDAHLQLKQAVADPNIAKILLRIDSPGGFSAGTAELADAVSLAAQQKPLFAFIEDMGASAAYWVASQAQKVFTNKTGIVGSIGSYVAIADFSGMAAKQGIKVHVIRAGEFKGAGTPGTEITTEQIAEWQRLVSDLNSHFLTAVAKGRGLPLATVRKLADGRAHVGTAAVSLGLADGIATLQETFAALSAANHTAGTPGPTRSKQMERDEVISQFDAAVREAMAANRNLERLAAVLVVARTNPQLHQEYVIASNAALREQQRSSRR